MTLQEDLAALIALEAKTTDPAVAVLRDHQQQLDCDGIMVGVSRQALDEVLPFTTAAKNFIHQHGKELLQDDHRSSLEKIANHLDCGMVKDARLLVAEALHEQ